MAPGVPKSLHEISTSRRPKAVRWHPLRRSFKNGRGDFYDQESINGKTILVRFSIWGLTPDRAQSEQAFSDDGGKTWETNWVNKYTRIPSDPPTSSQRPSQEKSEVGEVHDSRGGTVQNATVLAPCLSVSKTRGASSFAQMLSPGARFRFRGRSANRG